MNLKVLHIITSLTGGGAQRVLYRIVFKTLKDKKNINHIVLNLSEGGFYDDKFKKLNVKVINCSFPRGKISFKSLIKLFKVLKYQDYDVVQSWMYHSDFLGGIFVKLFSKKKILWNIRSANLSWSVNKWHTILIAKICSYFSYIIPYKIISNSNRSITYHKLYGYSKKKFELIYNGFESNELLQNLSIKEKLKLKYSIDEKTFVIGNIARWDPQKDQENLLKSLSYLTKKEVNIVLFLIGENISNTNKELINQIKKYKLDNIKIHLIEQTDDVYNFLNIFDISIISSLGESFPNAIPESMLFEVPVISTNVGDVSKAINDSTGWIVNVGDSKDLYEKINLAINEKTNQNDIWLKRKKKCREHIINFFGIDQMIDKYFNVWAEAYRELKFSNIKNFVNNKNSNEKKTICHIISSMSHGGAQQVLSRLIRSDKSVNHEIISLMSLGRYGNELANENYNILALNMNRYSLNFYNLFNLYRILKKKNYDLIQTWMYHADLIGGIMGFYLKKPVFWNIRNSDLNLEWSSFLTIFIQKICSKLSYKIPKKIFSCSLRAKKIHENIGYDSKKFEVIDNGYDFNEIYFDKSKRINFRKEFNLNEDAIIFGMLARWDPQKDFKTMIEAIKFSHSEIKNNNLYFFLAGPDVDDNNIELLNLIGDKKKYQIQLLGNLKNVTNFLCGIDCHVLSSAGNEGFPNVIAEAMACGLPCISTNVGDIEKIIFDKKWIVPTKKSKILSDKIIEMFNFLNSQNTESEIKDYKNKVTLHIRENFSLSKMISRFHQNWF